jgi:ParB/RepB/Spo0J family partition protein
MIETKVENIALDQIRPSKTNPRKHFDEAYIAELGESIRQKGIIQPLRVRPDWCIGKSDEEIVGVNGNAPAPQFFEIVAGECRYRGATVAKIDKAPVIVSLYSDKETLEIQLIENIQRADLTPIEEAEAYKRLIEMGHTVETIHERTGKDRKTIYGKLKILRAPKLLLDALVKGAVGEAHCEIVGRIPAPDMREKAAREILSPRIMVEATDHAGEWERLEGPMPIRLARVHVANHYMRSLAGAPFDLKDATLVAPIIDEELAERIGGGACDDCPLRSGNSPLLQKGDIKRPDICMNPRCLTQKTEAHFARLQERAVAEGKKLLTADEAADIFEQDGSLFFDSPYVKLIDKPDPHDVREDFAGRMPRWSTLLEKLEAKPPVTIARVPATGEVVELVDRNLAIEAVNLAAKQKGEKSIFDKSARPPSAATTSSSAAIGSSGGAGPTNSEEEPEWKKQERKNKEIAKFNFQVTLAAMSELVGAVEKKGPVKGFWPLLIASSIDHAGHDGCWLICKLHELDPKAKNKLTKLDGVQGAALEYGLSLTTEKEQLAFLVELLISQRVKIYNSGSMGGVRAVEAFTGFAKLYGVDVGEVERRLKTEAKEKKKKPQKGQSDVKAPPVGTVEHNWDRRMLSGNGEGSPKFKCKRCGATGTQIGTSWPPVVDKKFLEKPCVAPTAKPKKAPKDGRLSAAKRRRLAAKMKARWAARRAAAKKGGGKK